LSLLGINPAHSDFHFSSMRIRNQSRHIEPYKIRFKFSNYRQFVTIMMTRILWSFHEKNVRNASDMDGGVGLQY